MQFWRNCKLATLFVMFSTALLILLTFAPTVSLAAKGVVDSIPEGQTLYTQFSLYHENYYHVITNYRKGILVPVNTEVKFVKANKKLIIVKLPDDQELTIENIESYSGEKIDGVFTRTFATKPVDLSQFSEEEKKAILTGEVRIGMAKSTVLIALGYPPKHQTPSLKMDHWRYWQSRFVTRLVHFENDRVIKIE